MREGTSGLLYSQKEDGSIRVEVEDYGVGEFGGGDWERWYDFDKANADKLRDELRKLHGGTMKEMLLAEFGDTLDIPKFEKFCRDRGIVYSEGSWCS